MKENEKIRQKDIPEIKKDLNLLREKLFKLNLEREIGALKKNHQISLIRRKIARTLTILQEKQQHHDTSKQTQPLSQKYAKKTTSNHKGK